jgi:hypothetical protein
MSTTVAMTAASTRTFRTVAALAARWANTVHHVVKTSRELSKLRVSLGLGVLAGLRPLHQGEP